MISPKQKNRATDETRMKHGFFSVLGPCSFRGCKFAFRASDFGFRISAFRGVGRKRRRGCIVPTSGRKNQDGVFRIETWWERKVQYRGGIIVYVPTGSALAPLPPREAIGGVPKKRERLAFSHRVTPLRPPNELAERANSPRNNHILAIWQRHLAGGV